MVTQVSCFVESNFLRALAQLLRKCRPFILSQISPFNEISLPLRYQEAELRTEGINDKTLSYMIERKLLLGDEAVALGAVHAGISGVYGLTLTLS